MFSLEMIYKAIDNSIKNTSLNKLKIHLREYEWTGDGGLIRNDEPNMLDFIFKIINPDTSIATSNLKDEIVKTTISKLGNNIKYLLDDMYSNYTIIIHR